MTPQPSEQPRTAALITAGEELFAIAYAALLQDAVDNHLTNEAMTAWTRAVAAARKAEAAAPAPAGLTVLLMDDFDEMERQVEAHVRSCPNREDEVTQSCDLRTAWDALQTALAGEAAAPDPVASPAEAVRLLGAAIGIIDAADHRASAADGPVGHVRDEMTDAEWRVMYEALTEARRYLEGAVATPAPLDVERLKDCVCDTNSRWPWMHLTYCPWRKRTEALR